MREVTIQIGGIDCAACVERLSRLSEAAGVEAFTINPVNSRTHIRYDEEKSSMEGIERKIRRLGYSVSVASVEIGLEKPLTPDVVQKLRDMESVKSVDVQTQPPKVTIAYWDVSLQSEDFLRILQADGATPTLLDASGGEEEQVLTERMDMLRRMVLSVVLTMPLMWNPAPIVQFLLATLIQMIPNAYFYRGTWKSLRSKSLNMDSLIAISTTAIYLYSTVNAFTQTEGVQLYFLGQGVLSSILFFGKYMEILVKGQAGQAIKELLRLQPQTATVLRGEEKATVDVSEIQENDHICIQEGERIPTDGTLETGACLVNESMLTGESTPVAKRPGDSVYGGTYNCEGTAVYKAHNLGASSRLRQIVAIVEQAQLTKAPIQNMADKAAAWFIPAVLAISVGTFLVWYFRLTNHDLSRALMTMCGVLVIACPCALGLAAPTGMMVGSAKAAEKGVLFRGSAQIEKAQNITDIVFDKTGTLTMGKVTVSAQGERISDPTDAIRPEARDTVAQLRARGMSVWMVTGDREAVALTIGEELGIDREHVKAGVTPAEKGQIVRELQSQGKRVAMVGDGINDAPGLTVSDLAIAIGSGTAIAAESSDVILLGSDLTAICSVFDLSSQILRVIRGNFLWAIFYNAVSIPLACAGIVNPSIASAAMSFSSIFVLLRSLKLKK